MTSLLLTYYAVNHPIFENQTDANPKNSIQYFALACKLTLRHTFMDSFRLSLLVSVSQFSIIMAIIIFGSIFHFHASIDIRIQSCLLPTVNAHKSVRYFKLEIENFIFNRESISGSIQIFGTHKTIRRRCNNWVLLFNVLSFFAFRIIFCEILNSNDVRLWALIRTNWIY